MVITATFEEEVFQKPAGDVTNLEEVIAKTDLTFTAEEHWLVTRTAFTLQQKLETEILAQNIAKHDDFSIIKLKEQLFTPLEERLVLSLWESFSEETLKLEAAMWRNR